MIFKSASDDYEAVTRCICSAFFENVGQINPDGSYRLLCKEGLTAWLRPASITNATTLNWIVYDQLIYDEI